MIQKLTALEYLDQMAQDEIEPKELSDGHSVINTIIFICNSLDIIGGIIN